tara:strand:+ start:6853 stop:7995 length:1143 start_codon:yes stop_codon:yes gene_type:complete
MKNYLKISINMERYNSEIEHIEIDFKKFIIVEEGEDFKFSENKYTPSYGDKLFFLPGINIPRVKLKNLTLSHNVKSIRDIDKSSAVFANSFTFSKMVECKYYNTLPTSLFKQYFEIIKDDLDSVQVGMVEASLESYSNDVILLDYYTRSAMTDDNLTSIKNNSDFINQVHAQESSDRFNILNEDQVVLFKLLATREIFQETDIIELLNGDKALSIDDEVFNQLSEMMNSSDIENHTLVMEIIANCEYRTSLLYLMILFEKYGYIFMRSRVKSHINFKSLLSYLDLSTHDMNVSIDTIMKLFIKREVLTEKWIDTLLSIYDSEVRRGESSYFKCKTMTLNDEALAYLNVNYKRDLRDDFVPVVIEKVEEEVEKVSSTITWI